MADSVKIKRTLFTDEEFQTFSGQKKRRRLYVRTQVNFAIA